VEGRPRREAQRAPVHVAAEALLGAEAREFVGAIEEVELEREILGVRRRKPRAMREQMLERDRLGPRNLPGYVGKELPQ
jgi:hypothetical protein